MTHPLPMAQLVARLDRAIRDVEEGPPPAARAPAREAALRRLEKHLGLALPPTYRAFLELSDGYDRLAWPGTLWSSAAQLPGGARFAERRRLQREARAGGELDHDILPIGSIDDATNWMLYLDPERPTRHGELTVVEWTPAESFSYDSLAHYFEAELLARTRGTARPKVRRPSPPLARPPAPKFRGKSYRLEIDHSLSLNARLALGRFGAVDARLASARFPLMGRGVEEVVVHAVDLGRTGKGAARKLARLKLVPARLEHLLAFAARYPTMAWKEEFVALGSQTRPPAGEWPRVPRLRFDPVSNHRTVGLINWIDDWTSYPYRFLALSGS